MKAPTQHQRIIDHLSKGLTINRLQGWQYLGILELPARISELRKQGHNIKTEMIEVQNRYGETVRVAEWSMGE